ncbi:MAG TPA: endonuclease III [Methanoregulaceae archaeon]|nr:endonuclease III [Methanoregulaceae archaeon]
MIDREKASVIFRILDQTYPSAGEAPRHKVAPFQSVIITILSAQTTDRSVDEVSGPLFERFPTPEALSNAPVSEVEALIHKTGFYHVKAKRIIDASSVIVREFGGTVPDSMEELLRIPGVGRKTANIVLYHAFGKTEGVAVDTHVLRLSQMIGFSDRNDAAIVEQDLMNAYPKGQWGRITDLLISHGRHICIAHRPKCPDCVINRYCRYYRDVFLEKERHT